MDTLVVGLDAATWREIDPLLDAGELPTIGSLVESEVSGRLQSTTPPMTPPAWTSMATGVNPGKHGVFDFFHLNRSSYDLETTDYTEMDRPAVWDVFATEGVQAGVFNFPLAFPPSTAGEFFVSGIPSEVTDGVAHPPSVQERLIASDFQLQPKTTPDQGLDRYYRAVREQTANQAAVLDELLAEFDLDHLWTVFMGLDWAQHYLWETEIDGQNAVHRLYRQIDGILGELLDRAGDDTTVLIVSDHGARKIDAELHLNSILEQGGFLTPASGADGAVSATRNRLVNLGWSVGQSLPRVIRSTIKSVIPDAAMGEIESVIGVRHTAVADQIEWTATDAFAYGYMGRLYIHRRDAYAEGSVSSEVYETLIEELTDEFETLAHPETGERLFERVLRPEDIYEGPHTTDGADLILVPTDWRFMTYGDFGDPWIHPPRQRLADHEPEGVLIAAGPGIEPGTVDGNVTDIAPTLLRLHDLPIVEGMDGEVISAIAPRPDDDYRESPSRYLPVSTDRQRTEDEQQDVRERLEDLGYL